VKTPGAGKDPGVDLYSVPGDTEWSIHAKKVTIPIKVSTQAPRDLEMALLRIYPRETTKTCK
jgi:hypothetical protein